MGLGVSERPTLTTNGHILCVATKYVADLRCISGPKCDAIIYPAKICPIKKELLFLQNVRTRKVCSLGS